MRRVRALSLAVPALLCAGLATSPAASGQDVPAAILADARDGRIAACEHPAADVRRALDALPADADVLAPDLRAQLEASAEAHTSGRCRASRGVSEDGDGAPAGPGAAVPGSGAAAAQEAADASAAAAEDRPPGSPDQANPTPQPAPPNAAAPAARDGAIARAAQAEPARTSPGDAPAPLWLLLVLALLLALAALAWALLRASGSELPGTRRGRHARREAAWRASNAWAEFTDWVRLGR